MSETDYSGMEKAFQELEDTIDNHFKKVNRELDKRGV